jgi:hypothetical protein
MRVRYFIISALVFFSFLAIAAPRAAYASQAQDWYIGPQEEGSSSELTVFFPGVMATLDHRVDVYSGNQLLLQTGGIVTYPFGNLWVATDLRFLLFSIGGKVGFQDTWRNFTFDADDELSRAELRERSAAGMFDNVAWPYVQGRVTMAIPFNEYLLALSEFLPTYKDSPDRSYDWEAGLVHDRGMLYTWDTTIFFKHKKFGAIGPILEIQDFGLDGKRHGQINYGFILVTRAGLVRRNDIIVWRMLFHSGDDFVGGYDNSDVWGSFNWRGAFSFMLAYRVKIEL